MSECKALGRSTPKVPLRAGRAPGRANGRNGKAPDHQTLSMLHSTAFSRNIRYILGKMHRNFKKRKPNLVQKWNQTWISLLEKRDPKSRNAKKLRLISFPL